MVLASTYLSFNKPPDSALFFAKEGEVYGTKGGIPKYLVLYMAVHGKYLFRKGDTALVTLLTIAKPAYDGISQDNFTCCRSSL